MPVLQSYIAGQWFGKTEAKALISAINGETVAHTHQESINFAEAVAYARNTGVKNMLALDFQQRAAILKALAAYIQERKRELYAISHHTGCTKADSWIDIDGGFGTLFTYASTGRKELPSGNVAHEGPVTQLGKDNHFNGTHILVPRRGVSVHINAFNFPIWGMLEKFAPAFLAGMPCIFKPATATSYLTEATVRIINDSGLLPEGALQLVIGGAGDLLDQLEEQDFVTFTGSANTALMLKSHPNIMAKSIPFNAEADSLNSAIMAPDVTPEDEEFEIFAKEVVKEMTAKAGQKCTAIRRVLVPAEHLDTLADMIKERLSSIVVGDPYEEGVRMGALSSRDQLHDVNEAIERLLETSECVLGKDGSFKPVGQGVEHGAFIAPHLLINHNPLNDGGAHDIEAFGPVATLMPYRGIDEALAIAAKGKGSLVTTLTTKDPAIAAEMIPVLAAHHGRLQILDAQASKESTGHGSPLPMLKHGGPGRAGGGEELGGIRAVHHYLQRTAIQGSPTMVAAVTRQYVRGAKVIETDVHPFRRHFDDLQVGESLLTHRRTVTEADIVNFGCLSGDHFYMHFDDIAAKETQFGQRIAHGYFVLSAAAGLFVYPGEGPVLANYGLDTLRFITPVLVGDTIRARLTCKRKIDQGRVSPDGHPQGVVMWDVAVTNQHDELVASYDILTLVAKRQ
ncbi:MULTISPECIES: phenylacetic acid degradation bifunctional protein PaaZ [unclassified Halomonas]|uniref:phenylacetic acid degradation bifunctional protein PaaZ n=1 Tax=unclassified Halomonas TaxID=2609666 RepID=UPI0007D8D377|nr:MULTISPECIES: phenylacetic acid degradation bifunctional protein PaaZ [unclassified Halomonas]MBT2786450.1 phenylacetic acid degradation bifunctional protein PaaZ [Halomonas sp. ISL-106]MBT2797472.1 phenylacetic acid degradation bifunctional protein PaaZ [Halomonas sp. ISL-104]OAL58833.1 phenylacetic acid degradation bifunctional protein PaaZ [Halomonas sp. ALS9]